MKKRFILLLAALLLPLLAAPALADVIVEPQNDFYEAHREECEAVNRTYLAAGAGESINLYKSPEDGRVVGTVDNGEQLYISFVWNNWGCPGGGWVSMDELSLVYDSQAFVEEHQAQLAEYDGSGDGLDAVVLYTYPNSGETLGELEEKPEYRPFSSAFQYLYTDPAGLRWSQIGYYMGHRNAWACLDDPMNESLSAGAVEPSPSAAQLAGQPAPAPAADNTDLYLAAALVAALAVGVLLLVRKRYPRKG